MRHIDLLITLSFAAVLPAFAFMPWITIIADLPFALNGLGLVFGKYNIQPTEYYGLALAATACAGATVPHFLPRRRTLTRVVLALVGMGITILMQIHSPEGYAGVEWRMEY